MPNSDLIPSLLYKIDENQLALEAAIMELSNWSSSADLPTSPRTSAVPLGNRQERRIHQDDARGTYAPE